MVENGTPAEQVLARLATLRRGTARAHRTSPETDAQRHFVAGWRTGTDASGALGPQRPQSVAGDPNPVAERRRGDEPDLAFETDDERHPARWLLAEAINGGEIPFVVPFEESPDPALTRLRDEWLLRMRLPLVRDAFDGSLLSRLAVGNLLALEDRLARPVFLTGDPFEVVVRVGPRGIEVSPYQQRWEGPGTPVAFARPEVVVAWAEFDSSDDGSARLVDALADSRAIRRRTFRHCSRCGTSTPPEHRAGQLCHSCMEADGVVF